MNDLQRRLIGFASNLISTARQLEADYHLKDCLRQMIRSGTSAGANYSEAQSANSLKDFHNKIRISLKELKETNYWIGFLRTQYPDHKILIEMEAESLELMKIFGTIAKKTDPYNHPKSLPGTPDS